MQDKIEPHVSRVQSDDSRNIFTEAIDYGTTGKDSIWGKGYEKTLKLFEQDPIKGGKWLNLAAGDVRYNNQLLKYADSVIANDIDTDALLKLQRHTPREYRNKLSTIAFNLNGNFPLGNESINGVFCTGILHLFPKEVLEEISKEILRILKPGGRLILEFPSEIKRISKDGSLITFGNEPNYSRTEAISYLQELFGGDNEGVIQKIAEEFPNANPPFTFNSDVILWEGFKSTGDEKKDSLLAKSIEERTIKLANKKVDSGRP